MGLTSESSGFNLLKEKFDIEKKSEDEVVIALAGNPNTGKSTLFNHLTGLNQHTGNWPGKTVSSAKGYFNYKDNKFLLVDLPGTYSILANSAEEEVARDFLCFGNPDLTIVITDSTCLERNLNLALQVMEITDNVVLCLNLMDEAERKGISIDVEKLEKRLGIPVIPTVARDGVGVEKLLDTIDDVIKEKIKLKPIKIKYSQQIEDRVTKIERDLSNKLYEGLNKRWISLRLLDGDKGILDTISALIEDKVGDEN